MSDLISIISIILATSSFIFSFVVFKISQKSLSNQLIGDFIKRELEPQLAYSKERLWNLYEKWGEKFTEKYFEVTDKERGEMEKLSESKKIEFWKTTLEYQRKLVTNHYGDIAHTYSNKLLKNKFLFTKWSKSDLEIVNKVIVPLMNAIKKKNNVKKLVDETHPLLMLYNDSIKYG